MLFLFPKSMKKETVFRLEMNFQRQPEILIAFRPPRTHNEIWPEERETSVILAAKSCCSRHVEGRKD